MSWVTLSLCLNVTSFIWTWGNRDTCRGTLPKVTEVAFGLSTALWSWQIGAAQWKVGPIPFQTQTSWWSTEMMRPPCTQFDFRVRWTSTSLSSKPPAAEPKTEAPIRGHKRWLQSRDWNLFLLFVEQGSSLTPWLGVQRLPFHNILKLFKERAETRTRVAPGDRGASLVVTPGRRGAGLFPRRGGGCRLGQSHQLHYPRTTGEE